MRVPGSSLVAFAALAAAAFAAGCASSGAASTDVEVRPPSPWVASSEIARSLGLRASVAGGKATLESPAGSRILVFAGTAIASVRGRTVDLADGASLREDDVFVSSRDAGTIRAAWSEGAAEEAQAGSSAPVWIPAPPPPSTSPRPPVLAGEPAPQPSQNDPTPAERTAWSVPLRRAWKHIVIHHSASAFGSAAQIDRWHRDKGWDGLGYDFVIGNGTGTPDGHVEVGYRWKRQLVGAHAQTPGPSNYMNEHGIGIVLVGDFNRTKPSALQMRSLERLCAFLMTHCGIPESQILMHGDVKGTECPGRHFPHAFTVRPAAPPRTSGVGAAR
ncbi:MAG: hypothetical protein HMLKMBBP_01562 [Planctomycetes bacterium]|nr:hypothetical protein [Planctomycetota bacterium]